MVSCPRAMSWPRHGSPGSWRPRKTPDLIPLCHPLALEKVSIDFTPQGADRFSIETLVQLTGKTGVEMEAMTAAAVAALTLYDMVKAIDRGLVIESIRLLEKPAASPAIM